MPLETITVFRSGAFTTEPAPEWFQQVLADQTGDWDRAARQVLRFKYPIADIHDHLSVAVEVEASHSPGGGRYVEFSDVCQVLAEAWIPDPAAWIPFYTGHIAAFLRAHAEMATAGQLNRIGNCLVAFGSDDFSSRKLGLRRSFRVSAKRGG